MHPHLTIHFQPADKATKRIFAEIYDFVIINSKETSILLCSLSLHQIFIPFFLCVLHKCI